MMSFNSRNASVIVEKLDKYWQVCPDISDLSHQHQSISLLAPPSSQNPSSQSQWPPVFRKNEWGKIRWGLRSKHVTVKMFKKKSDDPKWKIHIFCIYDPGGFTIVCSWDHIILFEIQYLWTMIDLSFWEEFERIQIL